MTKRLYILCLLLILLLASQHNLQAQEKPMLFYSSCDKCRRIQAYIKQSGIKVEHYSLLEPQNTALMIETYKRYGIPSEEWSGSVALFAEGKCFTTEEDIKAYLKHGPKAIEKSKIPSAINGNRTSQRPLSPLPIALAGLADGINPCAFTTFILFATYLALAGGKRKDALLTGLAFATGVFIAYFGIGWGIFRIIRTAAFNLSLARYLNLILGVSCIIAAALSIRDYNSIKRGDAKSAILKLPAPLSNLSRAVLRKGMKKRYILPSAFIAGLAVSLIELVCTGQVYLPTLALIANQKAQIVQAYGYLVIYSLMFIAPLLLLVFLTCLGLPSLKLADCGKRAVALSKASLAVIFTGLGIYLINAGIH